jgi:hypothetical protein
MIVVVETNFIVELVLQQEQSHACEAIVGLCSSHENLQMAIPAFAVAEAGMLLERRKGERRKLVSDLPGHAREMGRTKSLRRVAEIVEELRADLVQAELEEASRWLDLRVRLDDEVEIIPLTGATFAETIAIQVGREIEMLPDAIVLASLKGFLEELRGRGSQVPVLFTSRDDKATSTPFGSPAVLKQLDALGCTYINSFVNAEARIRSHIENG